MLTAETPLPIITRWRRAGLVITIVGVALVLLLGQLGSVRGLSLRGTDIRVGAEFFPAAGLSIASIVSEDLACASGGELVRR
jgi:hypothetical protein